MEEDQKHGAVVTFFDVLQKEVPLDSVGWACRYVLNALQISFCFIFIVRSKIINRSTSTFTLELSSVIHEEFFRLLSTASLQLLASLI